MLTIHHCFDVDKKAPFIKCASDAAANSHERLAVIFLDLFHRGYGSCIEGQDLLVRGTFVLQLYAYYELVLSMRTL